MTNGEDQSPLPADFGIEDWRRLVQKALGGGDPAMLGSSTRDGIAVEPLYARRRDGAPLLGRGACPWTIVQLVDGTDPDEANAQALADRDGGATGLAVRFAGSPLAAGAGLPPSAEALRIALKDIDPAAVHLRIEPHAETPSATRWLADIVEKSGTAPELTDIRFGLEPIASLLGGRVPATSDIRSHELGRCVRELSTAGFRGPLALLDGRVCHEAGATEAQEVAVVLAAASWWLRVLDGEGFAPGKAASHFGASVAVDQDQLLSVAKLRALQLVLARFQEICEAPPSRVPIHAQTSSRMLTRADPTTNLLRTTLAGFAAGVGGADSITVLPYTSALGPADSDARALARNIQHLLIEEAQVHRVADPGAGSGAIEALTDALAERAWVEFQAIEREGGLIESLANGAFQARIAEARDALQKDLADGDAPLVGATIYPAPGEVQPHLPPSPPDALSGLGLASVRLEEFAEATG
jgi:methylmalonyl-CoA mutase